MIYAAAVIVVVTLVAMTSGKVDPVLALLLALIVAGVLEIAPADELFAGLSNAGVITVGGMLVIAKGIVQTGAVSRLTWGLLSATRSAQQAFRRLVVPLGVASSLMNTTPLVAMLVPATRELEQRRRIPARALLLPMAHATTLAGSVTLIGTSSNLVIAGIAGQSGVEISMVSFAPVALPVALVGWVVLYLTAPRLLKEPVSAEAAGRVWRVEIPVTAPALAENRIAAQIGVGETREYKLSGIQRWGEMLGPEEPIEADDLLVFSATEAGVAALWGSPLFGLPPHRLFAVTVKAGEAGTFHDFEGDGTIRVIAARTAKPLSETAVLPGDTCYVAGESADALVRNDAVALWQNAASRAPQPAKTWLALAVLAGVIVAASFGLAQVELAAAAGAVLMVLGRVITPRAAARAVDLKLLFILAGSIGLGTIVVSSGLADAIADGMQRVAAGDPALVLVTFAVTTAVMTNLVTNAATASILTPVAITVAAELGLDPVIVLALVATCVSLTFINPLSHQSNLMVMHPGGYTNRSFAAYGVPLLFTSLISVCLVAYFLGS